MKLLFGIRVRCDITMIELRKRLEHPRRRSLVQKEWEGFSESQEKAFQTRKRNTIFRCFWEDGWSCEWKDGRRVGFGEQVNGVGRFPRVMRNTPASFPRCSFSGWTRCCHLETSVLWIRVICRSYRMNDSDYSNLDTAIVRKWFMRASRETGRRRRKQSVSVLNWWPVDQVYFPAWWNRLVFPFSWHRSWSWSMTFASSSVPWCWARWSIFWRTTIRIFQRWAFQFHTHSQSTGYIYAVIMFAAAMVQSVCLRNYFYLCFRTGLRLRSSVITMVYA